MSRPTDYTEELAARICLRIADGETVKQIAADPDMPTRSTIYLWFGKYPLFSDMYEKSRGERADLLADEILQIADDGTNDTYEVEGRTVTDHDVIARSRLRVDARKWYAAKLAPKKYGEKLDIDSKHSGNVGLTVQITRFSDDKPE